MNNKMHTVLTTSVAVLMMASCVRIAPKAGVRKDTRGDDIQAYITSELDPARDAWQKPDDVMNALMIEPGEVVADVGAGAGYFTWRLSKATGDKGRVYAVESQQDLLAYLIKTATEGGYANVKVIEASASESSLPYKSTDIVLVCNALSRVDFLHLFFDDIRRGMKNGGKLAVIDWKPDSKLGPASNLRLPQKEVKTLLESMGFKLIKESDILPNQYFMIFELTESYE